MPEVDVDQVLVVGGHLMWEASCRGCPWRSVVGWGERPTHWTGPANDPQEGQRPRALELALDHVCQAV